MCVCNYMYIVMCLCVGNVVSAVVIPLMVIETLSCSKHVSDTKDVRLDILSFTISEQPLYPHEAAMVVTGSLVKQSHHYGNETKTKRFVCNTVQV